MDDPLALTDVCLQREKLCLLPFPDAAAVSEDQNSFCPSMQCRERGAGGGGVHVSRTHLW